MRRLTCITVLIMSVLPAFPKDLPHEWMSGTLVEINERLGQETKNVANSIIDLAGGYNRNRERDHVFKSWTIRTDTMVYVAEVQHYWESSSLKKPLNAQLEFAVEDDTLLIKGTDKNGKEKIEIKLRIVSQKSTKQ